MPQIYRDMEATQYMTRVRLPLTIGDEIEARHLEFVEVGAFNLPATAFVYREDVVGLFARVPLFPGQYIFPENVSTYRVSPVMDAFLAAGKRLVTISMSSPAQAISSHIQPGDIVQASLIYEERVPQGIIRHVYYPEELTRLIVFDVETQRGLSLERIDEEEYIRLASAVGGSEDLIPRTITFVVDDYQAALLIEAEYNAEIHLIFKEREPR